MAFSTDLAKLVSEQLARFVTLNRHQLAGQVANLDFWLAQIQNALGAIDGYGVRFVRMEAAQAQYVTTHATVEYTLDSELRSHERPAAGPRRLPDTEMRRARRGLVEAATRFL